MTAARRSVTIALGSLLALAQLPARAGWTLPAGASQIIVHLEHYETDRFFDRDGRTHGLAADGKYRKNSHSAYAEYGLRDSWMLFANLPLEQAKYEDDSGFSASGSSAGDFELGIRHRLSDAGARYAVSWQASIKAPLYGAGQAPQPGNHQFDLDLRLPLGFGFGGADRGGYITLLPGIRLREGEPTNEARLDLALGLRPDAQWLIELSGYWLRSLQRGSGNTLPTTSPGNGIDFDRLRLQLQAIYWLKPGFGLLAGGYDDVDGRNVGKGTAFFAGLWWRF